MNTAEINAAWMNNRLLTYSKSAAVELNGDYDSIQLTHSHSLRVRGSKWERLQEKAGMREDVAQIFKIAKEKNLLPSSKGKR